MAQRPKKNAALITGGARRIGAAIALKLADRGYDIALHYNHSRTAAEAVQLTIEQKGGRCQLFPADLADQADTEGLLSRVTKIFPWLNLLVNNASLYKPNTISNATSGLFDLLMAINLKAPCLLTNQFARICKKGHIINMLDTHITRNQTNYLYYILSKKALKDLTHMTALALAPRIRVNAIAPGAILPPEGKGEQYLKALAKTVPMKETGSVDQVLRALVFLLENRCYTGQILNIDGGMHLV